MKKRCALLLLMFLPAVFLSSISIEEFDGVVDFSVTLKELNALQDLDSIGGRFVVITGEVSARQVVDGEEATFVAELEIVDGEWIGAEQILIYRCIVVLEGPEFYGMVPAGRSRTKDPREIDLNSTILVVAEVLGFTEMTAGEYVPVINAVYLRKMG
jgi:hypothetical protein